MNHEPSSGRPVLVIAHNPKGPQKAAVSKANRSGILTGVSQVIPKAGTAGMVVRYRSGRISARRPQASIRSTIN